MEQTFFGLPNRVLFCRHCVISNQRPSSTVEFKHEAGEKKATIGFDETGVCDACRYQEVKAKEIDWGKREKDLLALLDKHRRTDGGYDVIVPGSGGKDSAYTSHVLKYKYGMNPLTVTWAPHRYTDIGWKNFENWVHVGGDVGGSGGEGEHDGERAVGGGGGCAGRERGGYADDPWGRGL